MSLAEVKETAKHLGVTFNDIVLAMAAGGLRELLLRYDGRADRPLMASVPVSTDRSPDRVTGNEIGGLSVSLPVHIDDPLERVRLTSLSTGARQGGLRPSRPETAGPDDGVSAASAGAGAVPVAVQARRPQQADERRGVQACPGPRERGHIGGAPVSEIYSIGVLSPGSAFNMTVWSYVDQVDISILSDDQTFDDVHEATDAMIHGLTEIRRAAGLSPLTPVDTAMAPAPAAG